MEYDIQHSDELTHWGVKGMKWGIRRYQNKDGSLTPAGKKHRAKLEAGATNAKTKPGVKASVKVAAKSSGKNNAKTEPETAPKKKTVAEMTDAELREHTNRMMLESQYYNAQRQLAAANPKQVSKGKKFVNSLVNDVIAPAAKNAGRAYLEKFMKDKLGLNQEDPIAKLEKQAKKLRLTKEIEDLKKGKTDDDISQLKKKYEKLDWEKKIRDLENPKDDSFDLSEALDNYRKLSKEDRDELKDAASMYENLDKIRKKGKTKD